MTMLIHGLSGKAFTAGSVLHFSPCRLNHEIQCRRHSIRLTDIAAQGSDRVVSLSRQKIAHLKSERGPWRQKSPGWLLPQLRTWCCPSSPDYALNATSNPAKPRRLARSRTLY